MQVKKINNEWYCYTNCGRDNSNLFLDWLSEVEKRGAGEIIITSISKGTFKGLDLELINLFFINFITNYVFEVLES